MLFFKKYHVIFLINILFSTQVSIEQADLIARNFINKESEVVGLWNEETQSVDPPHEDDED